MRAVAYGALFACCALASAHAQEAFYDDGNWTVTVDSRSPPSCAALQKGYSSAGLLIYQTNETLVISLIDGKLSWLEDGRQYEAAALIDNTRWTGSLQAFRTKQGGGGMSVTDPAPRFVEALRRGSNYSLMLDGATYGPYALRGTARIFEHLDSCLKVASVRDNVPTARSPPVFVLRNDGLYRVGKADQFVKLGEKPTLNTLGRRFSDANVSAEYEQGDEEYEYFKLEKDGVRADLMYDQSGAVTSIEVRYPGISDSNGAQVGDSVAQALGTRAYCNTHREDEPAYCKADERDGLRYDLDGEENCALPDLQHGSFEIPRCLKIAAILLHDANLGSIADEVSLPSFTSFPAPAKFEGLPTLPDFSSGPAREYKTRIEQALKHGPNFAGDMTIVTFGCGTSCLMGYVVSSGDGRVFDLPDVGEETTALALDFNLGSRLLVMQWSSSEAGRCVGQGFEWTGERFNALKQFSSDNC